MAMPSGNVVMAEKLQFPGGGATGNPAEMQHQPHFRPWFPDERDGFISWLRGEFAAANAIIDALCHHLQATGEPGEYETVVGRVQQRRCNWSPVLHMQQYFSIAEVLHALQQAGWRRQQRFHDNFKVPLPGKEFLKRSNAYGPGIRQGQGVESFKESHHPSAGGRSDINGNNDIDRHSHSGLSSDKVGQEIKLEAEKSDKKNVVLAEDKKGDGVDNAANPHSDVSLKNTESVEGTTSGNSDAEKKEDDRGMSDLKGSSNVVVDNNSNSIQNQNEKQNFSPIPKTFVGTEIFDGKLVNVLDGLQLYEGLYDDLKVSKLVSLVNDLRAAGKRGQFQGNTFVVSKRPIKGHGREMIQLGTPIADAPFEDDNEAGSFKDRRIEPIPALLQDVIDHIAGMQVMTIKPDSCIIDFYNEGDHSQTHMWPTWFGRPISLLTLTQCDLTFGRVILSDHPGDYRGSLRLSLSPGSLLVIQGKCADFAKRAIPPLRKQRILITFTKSQPKKTAPVEGQRLPSSVATPQSHWGQPPGRSPNPIRHPVGPKQYVPVSTTSVLPGPAIRPQLPPSNGIQPLFVSAPVAPPMPFPAPVALPPASTGWPAVPTRHPPSRFPVPGTGVFLPPPGSGNPPPHQITSASEVSIPVETTVSQMDMESGPGKSNSNASASPKVKLEGKARSLECNGSTDTTSSGNAVEEEQLNVETTATE